MDKEVALFEHNEIAYKKLCEALNTNRCATINHATGTGKSFIALKYLYNNRDKKYLYLAPTYPIIEQLKQSCYKIGITPNELNIDTMIYRNLLSKDMEELYKNYDGIIFDEYHRVGAVKTYRKIKELKQLLVSQNDNKKFIGLTATPIRYLDNERNMTKEVFDDVVASTLPLSDAMIDDLLPVPYYINSKISCRQEYLKVQKRVSEMPWGSEKWEFEERLKEIGKQINNGYMDNAEMVDKYITKKDGKYIVFCPTIDKLNDYYLEIDKWFSKFYKDKEFKGLKKYKVHSYIEKSKNQLSLDYFNEDKEGISLLFCVDLLNEGIHVDDIDGVFLLRRTVSPIIYFQQIGRALSFSGRNRQIQIFDLVNNFNNHNAIDLIYQEYMEEIQKRIKENPERAKEYKEKISRLQIKNETESIIKELDDISKGITREGIINSKIEYAIKIIDEKIQETEEIDVLNDLDIKTAYYYLSRYYKYVTTEQFKKLQEFNIILPLELSYTLEEREKMLNGYDTIYEKEKNISNIVVNNLLEFIEKEGRNVKINSENEYEKNLAMKYLYFLPTLTKKQKEEIQYAFIDNDIEFKSYEKTFFDFEILPDDVKDIQLRAKKYLDNGFIIPVYLVDAMQYVAYNYEFEQNLELLDMLEQNDALIKKINEEKKAKRYKNALEVLELLKNNIEADKDKLKELGVFDKIEQLSVPEINFLKYRFTKMKKEYYQQKYGLEKNEDLEDFKKMVKEQDAGNLQKLINCSQIELDVHNVVVMCAGFLYKKGKMPDINSKDIKERQIAKQYKEYVEKGIIDDIFSNIKLDSNILLYFPEAIIYDIFKEQNKNDLIKQQLLKTQYFQIKDKQYRELLDLEDEHDLRDFCANITKIKSDVLPSFLTKAQQKEDECVNIKNYFDYILKSNGRKPNENSKNEEERQIALKYKANINDGIIQEEISEKLINDFNSFNLNKESLKNIIDEKYNLALIKNIILKRMDFLYKNQRKPLSNSLEKEEKELADQFKAICMKQLINGEINDLNILFNDKKYIINTSIQNAKNIKMGEMINEK